MQVYIRIQQERVIHHHIKQIVLIIIKFNSNQEINVIVNVMLMDIETLQFQCFKLHHRLNNKNNKDNQNNKDDKNNKDNI